MDPSAIGVSCSLELPRMRLDNIGAGLGCRPKRLALIGAGCDLLAEACDGDAGRPELLNVNADLAELPDIVALQIAFPISPLGLLSSFLSAALRVISWMSL